MAAGWITLLKTVPWADVIAHAPQVADSARKLWNTVGRQNRDEDIAPAESQEDPSKALDARLAQSEDAVLELRAQLAQCSEVLTQMAEQNSFLIARVEVERRRSRWIAFAAFVSLLVGFGAMFAAVAR